MSNGEKSVNPLRDEASLKRSGNQKKKTHFVGLLNFFLTGLRPVLPLGQCSKFGISSLKYKVQIKISNFKVPSVRHWNCKRKSLKFLV